MTIRIIIRKENESSLMSYKASVAGSDVASGSGNTFKVLAIVRALIDSPQHESAEVEFESFDSRVDEKNIHALVTGRALIPK